MAFLIQWIGQGGFIVTLGDKRVAIDPYLTNSLAKGGKWERLVPPPLEPSALDVDMIVCTHDHADHVDPETIGQTDMSRIVYAGPDSCLAHFAKIGIVAKQTQVLNRGDTIEFGNAKLSGVLANHTSDSIGVVVSSDGTTVYFTGDSTYSAELANAKTHSPDILVACINGRLGNMNFTEAATLARELGVKAAIPCHYGLFANNTEDPLNFKAALKGTGVRYFEMEYGGKYSVEDVLNPSSGRARTAEDQSR
ncbi:MAG: hypothetical protein GF418_04990 [Chitinivibrionales bacterium]|nr:hypothetical protein [Chitinivibrionales bacterium]MBD3394965.1 hypothetical protein [Chitinivibrionales bacterium]